MVPQIQAPRGSALAGHHSGGGGAFTDSEDHGEKLNTKEEVVCFY